jgi:hypothetical protein
MTLWHFRQSAAALTAAHLLSERANINWTLALFFTPGLTDTDKYDIVTDSYIIKLTKRGLHAKYYHPGNSKSSISGYKKNG